MKRQLKNSNSIIIHIDFEKADYLFDPCTKNYEKEALAFYNVLSSVSNAGFFEELEKLFEKRKNII